MKVELDQVELNCSPLTGEVFVGTMVPNKNEWKHKKEVTNAFIGCVLQKYMGQTVMITSGQDQWEISVKKIKKVVK